MQEFFFDFETRSRLDLKKVGAMKYALHESTEATLITWAIGDEQVKAWRLGQPIPLELMEVASFPEQFIFIAHNAEFDYLIWSYVWARLTVCQTIPVTNIICTKGLTQRFGAGASLDDAATMLKMPISKDKVGRRLMLKQCKPNKKTGQFPELTPEEWQQFEYYGIIDTVLLRQVFRVLPPLDPWERWAWEWTFKQNTSGLKVDIPLLTGMKHVLSVELKKLNVEFNTIVGGQFNLTQRAKFLTWTQQYMPTFPDMRAETIKDVVDSPPAHVHPSVIRALEIKGIAGSASVKKVATALMRLVGDRIYGNLNYNGAVTKRWAGQGLQVHNFPRSKQIPGGVDDAIRMVTDSPSMVPMFHGDGVAVVKNLLRRIFVADQDKEFYCGDYSKIEPTVLFWLLDMGPIPEKCYEETAAEIFNKHPSEIHKDGEERQLGKSTFLGGSYAMGHKKHRIQCKSNYGLTITAELAKQAIDAYRRKYFKVVQFWHIINAAFTNAVAGRTTIVCNGKVVVAPMTGRYTGVSIKLPSGSKLYYHAASLGEGGLTYRQAQSGRIGDGYLYGGKLTENITSAIARDIMLYGMYCTEAAGFEVKNTVHDELWAMGNGGLEAFDKAMLTLPPWAAGISMTVDSGKGERYLK